MNRNTNPTPRPGLGQMPQTTMGDWLTVIATFAGLWFLTRDYLKGVWK